MAKAGRPVESEIRQNIAEILAHIGQGYGYEIAKLYLNIFPKVSQRVIYYHLKKGLSTKEFIIKEIKSEQGQYSWGGEAEKVYYSLGPNASLRHDKRVQKWFKNKEKQNNS